VLRVWPANVETTDGSTRIWVGTASYLSVDNSLPMISYLKTAPDFDSPLEFLHEALQGNTPVRTVKRDVVAPTGMEWDGEVLLGWETGESTIDSVQGNSYRHHYPGLSGSRLLDHP
jgi:hypothetical protein